MYDKVNRDSPKYANDLKVIMDECPHDLEHAYEELVGFGSHLMGLRA